MELVAFKEALAQGAKLTIVKKALIEAGFVLMQQHHFEENDLQPTSYKLVTEREYYFHRNKKVFVYKEDMGFLNRNQLMTLCDGVELTYYANPTDPQQNYWENLKESIA